jgi:SAM-dependent methyltransferase
MMDIAFLDKIREQEVAVAGAQFSQPPGRLLEIGAGTGAQAKVLSQRGFEVHAIDIAGSIYEDAKGFPVAIYDGTTIPFPDASFDIVFSSHVLMHIAAADEFQQEILRVLKPDGQVVHILPTTSWRFWTCLVHYPARYVAHGVRALKAITGSHAVVNSSASTAAMAEPSHAAHVWQRVMQKIMLPFTPPARIGERGNAWSEHYFFSEHCWKALFRRNGQVLTACVPNRLFYTGHMSFGSRIELRVRSMLSYLLGSAGKVYVLRAHKSS